jgi:hypothetical protein
MSDLLPKTVTMRTPNRTKDNIESQALGMILSERAREGVSFISLDTEKLVFSIWDEQASYSLFLHNKFLTEEMIGGYYFVSNIQMSREEFLDFTKRIKELAINTMIRWGQEPKIVQSGD